MRPIVPRFSASAASRASRREREIDAETAVRGLGAGDGLEDEIERRARFHAAQRSRHMREHARLRGDFVSADELIDEPQQRGTRAR
nr:hypothetical protein [Chthoniobacter flavus]